jgi:hypothetical protein
MQQQEPGGEYPKKSQLFPSPFLVKPALLANQTQARRLDWAAQNAGNERFGLTNRLRDERACRCRYITK